LIVTASRRQYFSISTGQKKKIKLKIGGLILFFKKKKEEKKMLHNMGEEYNEDTNKTILQLNSDL